MELDFSINEIEKELINLRRYFHENPELSWQEFNTQEKIIEYLKNCDIPCRKASKTGVIGWLSGKNNQKTIGIRADIDALKMEEKTNLEFSSKNKGVTHSCGHDAHISILLATAKILSQNRDKIKTNVVFIFQPAEEFIEDSGAKYMKEEPEIKKCDRLIALHIWSMLETGEYFLQEGPIMASSDTFDIEITGKGGHGAEPNKTIDPIIAGNQIINDIQTLVSREIDPRKTAVISITSFQSGTTSNVIPDTAHLMGTTRSFESDVVENFPKQLERICKGVELSSRAKIELSYHRGTPVTCNERECVITGLKAAKKTFKKESANLNRQMGGEDFSKYQIPYCFLILGGGYPEKENYPQHSPYFEIDEKALKYGVSYFVNYILEYQEENH